MLKLNFQFQAEADNGAAMFAVTIVVVVISVFAFRVLTQLLKTHGTSYTQRLADWLSKKLGD
jgi:hypothetical protein